MLRDVPLCAWRCRPVPRRPGPAVALHPINVNIAAPCFTARGPDQVAPETLLMRWKLPQETCRALPQFPDTAGLQPGARGSADLAPADSEPVGAIVPASERSSGSLLHSDWDRRPNPP